MQTLAYLVWGALWMVIIRLVLPHILETQQIITETKEKIAEKEQEILQTKENESRG